MEIVEYSALREAICRTVSIHVAMCHGIILVHAHASNDLCTNNRAHKFIAKLFLKQFCRNRVSLTLTIGLNQSEIRHDPLLTCAHCFIAPLGDNLRYHHDTICTLSFLS